MYKRLLLILMYMAVYCCLLSSQTITTGRNVLKTTFLSYLTGSTKLTYEHLISVNQSIEITGGVIGVGFDGKNNRPRGGLFRYAHKFLLSPNPHYPLNGAYFKPELALSSFNYDALQSAGTENTKRKNSTMGAALACFGYQWEKRRFTVDSFVGVGGALGNVCDTYYHHGFVTWDFFDKTCKYISLTFGVKLGVNFGRKKGV